MPEPHHRRSDCARCGRREPETCGEKFCPLNLPLSGAAILGGEGIASGSGLVPKSRMFEAAAPSSLKDSRPKFCGTCAAPVWPLNGTDVLACRRGHHQPNLWRPA